MRNHNFHWISALSLALGVAVTGCAKDEDADTSAAESTGGTTDDPSVTATMSASETSATMTTTMTTDDTDATTEPGTITNVEESTTAPPEPLPNGEMCDDNSMCISELCFVVGPLGGICGDCLTDADCEGGGCSIPNPLASPPSGAECNMGEPGEGCMSDAVCADGQLCAEILNVPGILVASTCGDCVSDADCEAPLLCSPSYDVANLSGVKTCVPVESVADGEGCDLAGSGNEACMSTHCVGADVLGVLELGVCNPCAADADCAAMETCAPPTVDLMAGLVVGGCVPA